MKYSEQGDRVTLEMLREEFETLLMIAGTGIGAASKGNRALFWRWLDFINQLNTGNPHFTPYEIPQEPKS